MLISLALCLAFAPDPALDARVEALLRQLTLEEKISLSDGLGFSVRPMPKIGLPELKMVDGPVGTRNDGPTTAYPAGVTLASTFNVNLATRFGTAIGRDARARGVHFWLAPGVNLARIPQNGRNFEYFGEDPFLAGRMATDLVRAVQAMEVAATVKHYVANDHEADRNADSSEVDERVLREVYLRPFEMVVKDGGAWALMTGYNLVNGVHMSEHDFLVNQVLKKEWGFRGVMMSDWGGTHSILPAALGGLDIEMPTGYHLNVKNLVPLVKDGSLPLAVVDDKARRIIRTTLALNWDRRAQTPPNVPLNDPRNAQEALAVAREGIVLLQNQRNTLPLDRAKVRQILIVGPNASVPVTGGGGSSYTTAINPISVEAGIRQAAPNATIKVMASTGTITAKSMAYPPVTTANGEPGWKMEVFRGKDLTGSPIGTRTVPQIDFRWGNGGPDGLTDAFSVRWTGTLRVPQDGTYRLVANTDDGVRLWVDGKPLMNDWVDRGAALSEATIRLRANVAVPVVIEYYDTWGEAVAQFGMEPVTNDTAFAQAIAEADVIVAAVGFNPGMEGEGFDRPWTLPKSQEDLLKLVTASGKPVVVAMNSGAGIDMRAWQPKAAAILQVWYPGVNGNQALAEIIFGDTNPSGKLPTTFPSTLDGTYYASAYPAVQKRLPYTEGLFMGYRWFDANRKAPLFPFGHGLSYTRFALGDLKVARTGTTTKVSVTVRNTGQRAGKETVQVYVEPPKGNLIRPVRELRGFAKVDLAAGQTKVVTVTLRPDAYALWDPKLKGWQTPPGRYAIAVGTSSRSLPLRSPVQIK